MCFVVLRESTPSLVAFRILANLLSNFPDAFGQGTDNGVREYVHVGFVSRPEPAVDGMDLGPVLSVMRSSVNLW